jgi:hypothetical protein
MDDVQVKYYMSLLMLLIVMKLVMIQLGGMKESGAMGGRSHSQQQS